MSADQTSPGHLPPELIANYRTNTLSPAELVLASRHLAVCEQCRRTAVRGSVVSRLISALGSEHLSFEQLESLVRNPAHAANGECLEHVTFCRTCAAELADLKAFRTTLGLTGRRKPRESLLRWLVPVVAIAIVLITFAGLEFVRQPAGIPAMEKPALVTSVRDLGGVVGVDATGQVRGVLGLETTDAQAVLEALRDGKVPAQPDMRDLSRTRETLLSGETNRPVLTAVGPTGTVVSSDRPLFRWKAPAGSGSFRIAVFDSDFNPVAASGPFAGTEWQPEKPMARGKTYIWTISGTVGGVSVTAPQSPEPEARFRVADQALAEAVLQRAAKSDLAYSLAAWKAGMKEEARTALARLMEKNPGTKELARLATAMAAEH